MTQQEQAKTELNDNVPVVSTNKRKNKKMLLMILSVVILLGLAGGGYSYFKDQQQKAQQKQQQAIAAYRADLRNVVMDMLKQAAPAETICGGYSEVWRKAIDRDTDFNVAIQTMRNSVDDSVTKLNSGMDEVTKEMQRLNNPPKEYKQAYDIGLELYSTVKEFAKQADSPTGSLNSFNEKTRELTDSTLSLYDKFDLLVPVNA